MRTFVIYDTVNNEQWLEQARDEEHAFGMLINQLRNYANETGTDMTELLKNYDIKEL